MGGDQDAGYYRNCKGKKGLKKGKQLPVQRAVREVLLDLLFERFGVMPAALQKKIGSVDSLYALKFLSRQAIRCTDMEAFEGVLGKVLETPKSSGSEGNTSEVH